MLKYIIFFICIFFKLPLKAQFYCQKTSDEPVLLSTLIEDLTERYDLNFAYPSIIINEIKTFPPSETFTNINALVKTLLSETELEYEIQANKNILLREIDNIKTPIEKKISITGLIKDQNSSSPLIGASIYLDDFKYGTFSDNEGRFNLSFYPSAEAKNIIISYIGYKEIVLPLHSFTNHSILKLQENTLEIESIIIEHSRSLFDTDLKHHSIGINKQSIDKNQANLVGGTDVFRLTQLLPGVSAHNDNSAEIQIRGSDGQETLILLDNIPIYHTDHYYGIFGAINASFLDEARLYKNILPIEHQGGTAGLLKMSSSDQIASTSADLEFNLLNTLLNIETAITPNLSFQFAGRTSLWDVNNFKLNNGGQDSVQIQNFAGYRADRYLDTNPSFKFYDLNAKINARMGENTTLSLAGFKSSDKYKNIYSNIILIQRPNRDIQYLEDFSFNENWENNGLSAKVEQGIGIKNSLSAIAHYSNYNTSSNLMSSIARSTVSDLRNVNKELENKNEVTDYGLKLFLNSKSEKDYTFGLSWNHYSTNYQLNDLETTIRDIADSSNLLSLVGSYSIILRDLKIDLGSRLNRYSKNEVSNFYLSPQLSSIYSLNKENSFKFSVTQNFQFVRNIQYENRVGQTIEVFNVANNNKVKVGKSLNYMLGYNYKKADWGFDLELFYKDMSSSLEFTNINPGFLQNDPLINKTANFNLLSGNTTSVGVDLMLSYQNKKYGSWIAYTLSKTENNFEDIYNGQPYPNQNDRRHQFKWVNQLKLNKWSFSINYIYSSGKPYLSFLNLKELLTKENAIPKEVYQVLPYYSRIDIGLSYQFLFLKKEASVGASIFNLSNRQNVKFIQQTYAVPLEIDSNSSLSAAIGSESSLLDRTFDLSLKLKF